jgi:hypothetical protein
VINRHLRIGRRKMELPGNKNVEGFAEEERAALPKATYG